MKRSLNEIIDTIKVHVISSCCRLFSQHSSTGMIEDRKNRKEIERVSQRDRSRVSVATTLASPVITVSTCWET
jgi:hypothetical protein